MFAPNDKSKISHPDWHTPSWLTADELETVIVAYEQANPGYAVDEYKAILAMMKALPTESRFVFWFDN